MTFNDAIKLARTMCTHEAISFVCSYNDYMRACDRFRRGMVGLDVKDAATAKFKAKRIAFIESMKENYVDSCKV